MDCSELILDVPVCRVTKGGAWMEVDEDRRKNGNEVVVPRRAVELGPLASGTINPF
jgi:hypothetical protein